MTGRKLFGVAAGIAGTCLIIGIEAFHGLGDELPARGRRSSFQIATLQVPISAPLISNQPRTRFVEQRAEEALSVTPVVLIIGPRRAGKTTLVRKIEDSNLSRRRPMD